LGSELVVSIPGTIENPEPARQAVKVGIVEPTGAVVDSKPLSRLLARVKMVRRLPSIVARDRKRSRFRGFFEFSPCRAPF
jgi:hypothetical protein